MTRIATLVFALCISHSALAGDTTVRDARGEQVSVADQGTVMLFWSMEDSDSAAVLADLQELAEAGRDVIAVNMDGADQRARIRPFLTRHGIEVRSATDPTGEIAMTYGARCGEAVVLERRVEVQVTWKGSELDQLRPLPERPGTRTAEAE